MNVYLDASVLIALLTQDPHTGRANAYFQASQDVMIVSDFAAAEFSAVIARHVRDGRTTSLAAKAAFADFDTWVYLFAQRVGTDSSDVRTAEAFIRGLALNLRAPDALHVAIVQRLGATLATFDQKMAANAGALGIPLAAM